MTVSTHVLDTRIGRPAVRMPIRLDRYEEDTWQPLAEGETDDGGRWSVPDEAPGGAGLYRLRFGTGRYFAALGGETFYPEIAVIFNAPDPGEHHHVPLLLSPFGYSTYRGS
ncbi:hydroxyisourate hydrolase [Actinomadura kijaniata]|uniref:5-hydroxyisourate hydrolase n=2 Tax=Actinomadura TaxID=1988 RepID=A0A7W3LWX4_ACTNM|nr:MULTISPECIES: hydroxyisourate hydrolase [Actinomadura]MBA8955762.1 5-hydroxyisourate hydrolase [Actinomadura namibiensis]